MISIILRPDESVSWDGRVLNEIMCHRREFGIFMIVRGLTYGIELAIGGRGQSFGHETLPSSVRKHKLSGFDDDVH